MSRQSPALYHFGFGEYELAFVVGRDDGTGVWHLRVDQTGAELLVEENRLESVLWYLANLQVTMLGYPPDVLTLDKTRFRIERLGQTAHG